MVYRTNSAKRVRGGKRCVVGGPNLVSCGYNQRTEGISIYLFPNAETYAQRQKSGKFSSANTARPCFIDLHTLIDDSCLDVNRTLSKKLNMWQRL